MSDPHWRYEIRCPVHGFISINDWEREIIGHPAFQRLRRIRQLAWTDQVYPGAMHTRFEHSLGVMHMASQMYDSVVQRSGGLLKSEYGYDDQGLDRDKKLVRIAALVHDVGHSPFSHAGEESFPFRPGKKRRYLHEEYSAAIIRFELKDVIENHRLNGNCDFKAEDVAALIEGSTEVRRRAFWRELISGQMDADRMDYPLRDSLHAGVDYGRYDWRRLLNTIEAMVVSESDDAEGKQGLRLGVNEGGIHAAEALVLARYYMFTQVYFHKTRIAFDQHLRHTLAELLPGGAFPPPTQDKIAEYLKWDDWKVLGQLAQGRGGEHGRRLSTRDHYREIYHTPEAPDEKDLIELKRVKAKLGKLVVAEEAAGKSWYKVDRTDIPVISMTEGRRVSSLSAHSPIVNNMRPTRKVMLYVEPERAAEARNIVRDVLGVRK